MDKHLSRSRKLPRRFSCLSSPKGTCCSPTHPNSRHPERSTLLALAVAFVSASTLSLVAHAQAPQSELRRQVPGIAIHSTDADPMLAAMQAELEREKTLLVLPGQERPYFIEYRLDDLASYEALANYGALTREEDQHQRIVRVTVRIGNFGVDSSSSRGDGSVQLAPEDNDPAALRYALWTATDEAYKAALRAYSAKIAALKRFQTPPTADDFSPARPVTHIEPLQSLQLDRADWKRRITEASGLYTSDKRVAGFAADIQYSTANLRALAINRYLVNTEGTVLRQGFTGYAENISVGTQASDGMRLSRENGSVGRKAADLESEKAFNQRVVDNLTSLDQLRKAPLVSAEDYHGPVLFSGDAAADTFTRLFTPNIEADRPEMGTSARTQGAYTSSLRSKVLPEFMNVFDDPTETTLHGKDLIGSYAIDDEGVPAQKVTLVEKGKLENYLIGRSPVKDFPSSNGHGRAAAGQAAHSHSGVIVFQSTSPVPVAQLHAKLLAMAKEEKRDVYEVETLGGELVPRMLYQLHPDGTRTLVRGAVFDELDNRSLRSEIVAAGDDAFISNQLNAFPQTTVAPSLLFGDITVKRATEEQQKLPHYAPPAVR